MKRKAKQDSMSIRALAVEIGLSSLRGVTNHLDALERKGFISRIDGNIRILKDPQGNPVKLDWVSQAGSFNERLLRALDEAGVSKAFEGLVFENQASELGLLIGELRQHVGEK